MDARRCAIANVLGWWTVVAGALVAVPAVLWSRLPADVAVHWGTSGAPDGHLPRELFVGLSVVLWCVVAGTHLAMAVRGTGRRVTRMWVGGLLGLNGGLMAAASACTVRLNLDRPDWHAAGHLNAAAAGALAAATVAGAALGCALGRLGPDASPTTAPKPAAVTLPEGEPLAWEAWVGNRGLLGFGGAMAVTGTLLALCGLMVIPPAPAIPMGVLLLVTGLLLVLLGAARVEVDERGLTVAYGPWGWPVWTKPLHKIESARVEPLEPMEVGGWGLRGWFGNATLMIRVGEGLVLTYVDGGRFAVTVDDADHAAAILNTLLERAISD